MTCPPFAVHPYTEPGRDALHRCLTYMGNLGCGRGYSVLEVIRAFEKASGRRVPYRLAERRPGDIAANWCDPTLAKELFGWEAKYDIDAMCRDSWRFESMRAAQKQRAD